jgi:hypothetical protein
MFQLSRPFKHASGTVQQYLAPTQVAHDGVWSCAWLDFLHFKVNNLCNERDCCLLCDYRVVLPVSPVSMHDNCLISACFLQRGRKRKREGEASTADTSSRKKQVKVRGTSCPRSKMDLASDELRTL